MKNIIKGRILLVFLIIFSSISFGYIFFKEAIDYPILYIYSIPSLFYIPVMAIFALIISFKKTRDKYESLTC